MARKTAAVFREERSERDNDVFLKEHLWKTLIGVDSVLKHFRQLVLQPTLLAMLRMSSVFTSYYQ